MRSIFLSRKSDSLDTALGHIVFPLAAHLADAAPVKPEDVTEHLLVYMASRNDRISRTVQDYYRNLGFDPQALNNLVAVTLHRHATRWGFFEEHEDGYEITPLGREFRSLPEPSPYRIMPFMEEFPHLPVEALEAVQPRTCYLGAQPVMLPQSLKVKPVPTAVHGPVV